MRARRPPPPGREPEPVPAGHGRASARPAGWIGLTGESEDAARAPASARPADRIGLTGESDATGPGRASASPAVWMGIEEQSDATGRSRTAARLAGCVGVPQAGDATGRLRTAARPAGRIVGDEENAAASNFRASARPARPLAMLVAGALAGAACLGLLQAPALAAPQDPAQTPPQGAPKAAPKAATQTAPKTALQTAPLPPRKPQTGAAAPQQPARSAAGKPTPLPPDRPAEIEEAREAEADAQPVQQTPTRRDARPAPPEPAGRRPSGKAMPLPPDRPAEIEEAREAEADAQPAPEAPVRLAARPATPEPAGRRSGKAMPLPPDRPAEIEEAREAEAQAAAPQETAPQQAQPAPLRLATRTTAPDPALAVPDAEAPGHEPGTLPAACAALVEDGAIRAELDKSIPGKGTCGLAEPVRLTAVRLADGTMVPLKPASISNCAIAAATAAWVREDLAPAAAAQGAPVTAVRIAASYDCRPRNRIPGARMSEHGLGNAVDVGGFELADGRVLAVEKGGLPPRLRAIMKESACRRFTTVLGPGSDGYHEDHIHVDLAQRRLDIRLCRWNLDAGTAVASRKGKPAAGKSTPEKPDGDAAQPPETEAATDAGSDAPAAGSGSQKP